MERRVRGNSHARCGVGENPEEVMRGVTTHHNQKITYHYKSHTDCFWTSIPTTGG